MTEPRNAASLTAFRWPVRVYWEDTDAGGIVFYANYLKFMERARTEWLRKAGIAQSQLKEQSGCMFVVSATNVQYHRPARLDDQLIITAAMEQTGRASISIAQEVFLASGAGSADAPQLLCSGQIRLGWVHAESFKPMRIPSSILEVLK